MKKFLALMLALVMALSLVACGSKPAGGDSNTGDSNDDANTDGDKVYKVAMICDSSINDGGWGAACYNAMVTACDKQGWQYEVTDSISQDQYYDSITAYCALGYDMIYAPGNQYTDAVLQAAEEYPDIAFALLNGAEKTPGEAVNGNISSLLPNAQQIGWIAGALAGLMTESGKLGFIGGMELDTTKGKIAGFEEAAKYVAEQEGKTVELLNVPYANSFSDAPKGKEFATELISQGADVFFGDASAVDSGAREAIDAANAAAGSVKIYDIGQPADKYDVTFENCQARVRTLELMDYANKNGGFVIGTGDLSELALGWATYNGDHMSMYGVNAGVPKTLVRHLVRYEADIAATDALRTVLLDILDTPVSPELLPAKDGEIAQKTEDLVGPYELHDFYLYQVLRFGFGPAKIFRLAKAAFAGRPEYPDSVLYKWLRNFYWRFFAQQFKRSCLPDGPKVGSVTLSPRGDWRMPSDACAALWLAELEQLQIKD